MLVCCAVSKNDRGGVSEEKNRRTFFMQWTKLLVLVLNLRFIGKPIPIKVYHPSNLTPRVGTRVWRARLFHAQVVTRVWRAHAVHTRVGYPGMAPHVVHARVGCRVIPDYPTSFIRVSGSRVLGWRDCNAHLFAVKTECLSSYMRA